MIGVGIRVANHLHILQDKKNMEEEITTQQPKETPKMDTLVNGTGQGATFASSGNDAMLAALLSQQNYRKNDDGLDQTIANQVSELRRDVAKSESDLKDSVSGIKDTIQRLQLENTINFKDLDNRLCTSEKEQLKATFENREKLLDTKYQLSEKIDRESEIIKKDLIQFRFDVDKQFCEVQHQIEKGFDKVQVDGLKERIANLKDELNETRDSKQTSDIVSNVLRALLPTTATPPVV